MGRGDEKAADQAAVDAMRRALNGLAIDGTVVIGEGERDEAPMLFIGEKVGRGHAEDPEVDIAVDPLEGTNLCATGEPNAIAVLAAANKGGLLHAPDCYMEKIIVGPAAKGAVHLDATPKENLTAIAKRLGRGVKDLRPIECEVVDAECAGSGGSGKSEETKFDRRGDMLKRGQAETVGDGTAATRNRTASNFRGEIIERRPERVCIGPRAGALPIPREGIEVDFVSGVWRERPSEIVARVQAWETPAFGVESIGAGIRTHSRSKTNSRDGNVGVGRLAGGKWVYGTRVGVGDGVIINIYRIQGSIAGQ